MVLILMVAGGAVFLGALRPPHGGAPFFWLSVFWVRRLYSVVVAVLRVRSYSRPVSAANLGGHVLSRGRGRVFPCEHVVSDFGILVGSCCPRSPSLA